MMPVSQGRSFQVFIFIILSSILFVITLVLPKQSFAFESPSQDPPKSELKTHLTRLSVGFAAHKITKLSIASSLFKPGKNYIQTRLKNRKLNLTFTVEDKQQMIKSLATERRSLETQLRLAQQGGNEAAASRLRRQINDLNYTLNKIHKYSVSNLSEAELSQIKIAERLKQTEAGRTVLRRLRSPFVVVMLGATLFLTAFNAYESYQVYKLKRSVSNEIEKKPVNTNEPTKQHPLVATPAAQTGW